MRRKYISGSCQILSLHSKYSIGRGQHRTAATLVDLKGAKPYESIPGLSSLPFIGPLHQFLPVIGEIGPDAQIFAKLGNFRKKYGPIVKFKGILGRNDLVFLFEPDHFEQVFRAEESMPFRYAAQTITHYREVYRKEVFGNIQGLISANGPQWRDMRTKVNPAMLKPKLVTLYKPGLDGIANDMVAKIDRIKDDPDFGDKFQLEMTKWALESVAFVSLGARIGCLDDDQPEDHPGRQLIECAHNIFDLSFRLEFMPSFWKIYPTRNYKKMMEVLDKQWEISTAYLNEARKNIEAREHDIPEEDKGIIEKLLAVDEKVAIVMANDMLLAGIDTVSFITLNVLYHIATNLRAQEKLREEIKVGDSERYLKACVKEAMRIYHVVPANLRRSTKDHVVGGYHIPAGVDVVSPNEYLSNLEEYYPRAKEFLPERWLVDKSDPLYYGNTHPMVTMPFGFGVRSCIGRRIAEQEIQLLTKQLIEKYNVTWEGSPVKVVTKLLNSFPNPLHFKFTPVQVVI